jgi:TetR/AcrR family transcriptional regulator
LAEKRKRARRDGGLTRQRILAAATKEFAAKGLEGARVDEIALRSRANKNMIYHYYRSKDGLFQAVLEEMYGTIRTHQGDREIENLSPAKGMRVLVESMFDVFHRFPDFVSLLQSENLAKAEHIKSSARIAALYNPLAAILGGVLRRGSADGVFRSTIDPINLYVSIASLAAYHISNRYTLSALFGTDIGSARAVRRRRSHVVDVILRYVRNASEIARAAPEGPVSTRSY